MVDRDRRARSRLSRRPPSALIVATLALAGMSASFMQTLVIPIQSELPELLAAPREDTAWVITVTLLSAAIVTPIAGRLGDMYGKRRIILALLFTLIVGSMIAALSPGLIGVVVGRGLQGAAMGIMPLGISVIRDVLHEDRIGGAIALMSATLGVGGAIGMPVSAIVAENLDWHVLFWLAAVLGAVNFVLVLTIVPVSTLRSPGSFDFIGTAGLSIGLAGVLLAVSRGADWGWTSAPTLAFGLGGIAVLLAWGWFELRIDSPLVDLRVAARPQVLFTNLAAAALGFSLFVSNVAFPQLLELPVETGVGLGLSLLQASLVIMPAGLVMMLLSPISARLVRLTSPRVILAFGGVAIVIAFGIAIFAPAMAALIFVANVMIGVGIGLSYASMPVLIMSAVPATETAAANGLNTLMRSLGTSVAAAATGMVLAAFSTTQLGMQVPSLAGFQLSFVLGAGAAVTAVLLALLIPRGRRPIERRPSLPPERY